MKKRIGFVSNSSSSSFVVRMKVLTPEQIEEIKAFAKKHEHWFETEIEIGTEFIEGYLEAHNGTEEEDDSTALEIFSEMMDSYGVTSKDYATEYCGGIDEVKERICQQQLK